MDVKITDASTLQPKDITILNDPDASTITLSDPTTTVTVATDQLAITTSAESSDLGDLQDVTITSVSDGQLLSYDNASGKWINSSASTGVTSVNSQTGAVTLDTDDIQEDGSPTNKYFTDARARSSVSVTDAGGDGSLAYNSSTGVITYTGPSASEVRAHFSGGTGVTITDGTIAIGQPVGTTDDVTFGEVESTEFIGPLRGEVLFKAQAGEALTKGDAVYVSGISGSTPVVSKANASSASHMPAFGVAGATVSSSAAVDVITFGQATNLDTTGNGGETWALGDEIYVSATTAGDLTNVQPTGESNLVQKIAKVEKLHALTGTLLISGAGRSNATPNLNNGNIFIGNSSNYAETVDLDTKITALGYITASSTDTLTNKSGNISQWTNDAGYLTSETDSQTLSFSSPNLTISNGNTVDISAITSGYVTPSSVDTFTNKTFDVEATGNSISNIDVADLKSGVLDTDLTSVSASDDTLASAKAIKTYADTKLSDVVGDTTPQLGGDLDVNGQSIVSTSNGNITVDPDGTGKLYVEGDSTTPGSYGDRLTRLRNAPLIIDNNQSNAWWGSQMIMKDNSDDVFAMVGRQDTSAKVYGYIITMDPNGNNTNTSAFAGDYGFYFNMQYEGGSGSDWYMIHNVFGADDGYFINSFGSGHNSYARTPLILNGSLTVTGSDVDLKGLELKDSTGSVTIKDNVTVNLTSGGTTAVVTENESATGSGNRITVGTTSTAHTDGVGFEVRRGTGSTTQTQFKVETASSQTRTSVTSALNVEPVAYANLHSSPTEGDLQFLTTDGAGSNKHKPIYYDGVDWRYFNDDSVVASS